MNILDFSYNWNNKLNNAAFTSLRLRNDEKYVVGSRYAILLKDKKIQEAELVAVKHFLLNDINEFIARIDTGYTRDKCIELIKVMYKNKGIDFNTKQFSLLLFAVDKFTVIAPDAVNDKIALFCRKYEQYVKIKYKVSASDSGKIKLISITEIILDHYFTTDNFTFKNKYSIANITKYYNELIADISSDKISTGSITHPNSYNTSHVKKLTGAQLSAYYQHLISLGLVSKKDRFGNVIDFVKPQQ